MRVAYPRTIPRNRLDPEGFASSSPDKRGLGGLGGFQGSISKVDFRLATTTRETTVFWVTMLRSPQGPPSPHNPIEDAAMLLSGGVKVNIFWPVAHSDLFAQGDSKRGWVIAATLA